MKRIHKIINITAIIFIIPLSVVVAQDKKNEQKIKIIVKDGPDTKVMIDTVLSGDHGLDSLILKDGSVVHLKHHRVSADDKDGRGITREMTVISSDSMDINDDNGNVMYYRNDRSGHHRYKVIRHSSDEIGDNSDMVWVDKGGSEKEDDYTFTKHISENESDSDVDKTRFVIARDGMVVTIEGTDEAKTKELAKEIEKKLGVTGSDDKKSNKK